MRGVRCIESHTVYTSRSPWLSTRASGAIACRPPDTGPPARGLFSAFNRMIASLLVPLRPPASVDEPRFVMRPNTLSVSLSGRFGDEESKDASKARLEGLGLRRDSSSATCSISAIVGVTTSPGEDRKGRPAGKYPRLIEKHGGRRPYPDVEEEG